MHLKDGAEIKSRLKGTQSQHLSRWETMEDLVEMKLRLLMPPDVTG